MIEVAEVESPRPRRPDAPDWVPRFSDLTLGELYAVRRGLRARLIRKVRASVITVDDGMGLTRDVVADKIRVDVAPMCEVEFMDLTPEEAQLVGFGGETPLPPRHRYVYLQRVSLYPWHEAVERPGFDPTALERARRKARRRAKTRRARLHRVRRSVDAAGPVREIDHDVTSGLFELPLSFELVRLLTEAGLLHVATVRLPLHDVQVADLELAARRIQSTRKTTRWLQGVGWGDLLKAATSDD